MKRLYLVATAVFWLAVAGFWGASLWLPEEGSTVLAAGDRRVSADELARHARPDDCWMAIRGSVYDLGAYLPQHPSPPDVVLPWCGREATQAYLTKTRGRAHSPYADELLARYRIGVLVRAP